MPRRSAPRFNLLRIVWAGLFALALMMQPMVATMGEVHELAHAVGTAGAAGAHDDHNAHDHGAGQSDQAPDDADSEDPVHLLLHFAHCCAQAPTPLGTSQAQVPGIGNSETPLFAIAELRLKPSTNDVLRPPITA